jgi:uncharacterized circularly permuted ATP-grasp superfamily protein
MSTVSRYQATYRTMYLAAYKMEQASEVAIIAAGQRNYFNHLFTERLMGCDLDNTSDCLSPMFFATLFTVLEVLLVP